MATDQELGRQMDLAKMRLGQAIKAIAAGRKTMGRDNGWADPKDWLAQSWAALDGGLSEFAPLPLAWTRSPIPPEALTQALQALRTEGWALPVDDRELASAINRKLMERRAT